jgi:hypothetical protein
MERREVRMKGRVQVEGATGRTREEFDGKRGKRTRGKGKDCEKLG